MKMKLAQNNINQCFFKSLTLFFYKSRNILWVIIIFLIALLYRISAYYLEGNISRDGVKLIILAQSWHESNSYQSIVEKNSITDIGNWTPPLLPFILKIIISNGKDPWKYGSAFNILCGALLVIPIYDISLRFFNKKFYAIFAALLIALNPVLCDNCIDLLREPLYLLFSACMLSCAYAAAQNNFFPLWILSGIFQGLSFLCRLEAIEFLLWACVICFYFLFLEKKSKKNLIFFFTYIISCTVTIILISYILGTENQIFMGFSRIIFHFTGKYL